MEEARLHRTAFETETRFRRADGGYAVVKVTVSPNIGDDGELVRSVCSHFGAVTLCSYNFV